MVLIYKMLLYTTWYGGEEREGWAFQGDMDVSIDLAFVTQPSPAPLQHPLTSNTPPSYWAFL